MKSPALSHTAHEGCIWPPSTPHTQGPTGSPCHLLSKISLTPKSVPSTGCPGDRHEVGRHRPGSCGGHRRGSKQATRTRAHKLLSSPRSGRARRERGPQGPEASREREPGLRPTEKTGSAFGGDSPRGRGDHTEARAPRPPAACLRAGLTSVSVSASSGAHGGRGSHPSNYCERFMSQHVQTIQHRVCHAGSTQKGATAAYYQPRWARAWGRGWNVGNGRADRQSPQHQLGAGLPGRTPGAPALPGSPV